MSLKEWGRPYVVYYGYIRPAAGWLWCYVIRPSLFLVAVLGWAPVATYLIAKANGREASEVLQSTNMLLNAITVLFMTTIVLVAVSIAVGIYFILKQILRGLKAMARLRRQRTA